MLIDQTSLKATAIKRILKIRGEFINNMEPIVPEFERSLFAPLEDAGQNLVELGIDTLTENELVKQIPIVNSLIGVIKVGYNLHERNLLLNTLAFIQDFNTDPYSEKVRSYIEEIRRNEKKAEKELGRVLIILNRIIDSKKAIILSGMYRAYIERIFNWDIFCDFAQIIEMLQLNDIPALKRMYQNISYFDEWALQDCIISIFRLLSLGLVDQQIAIDQVNMNAPAKVSRHYRISKYGKDLYRFGITRLNKEFSC